MAQFHVHRSKRIFIKIYRNIPAYYILEKYHH